MYIFIHLAVSVLAATFRIFDNLCSVCGLACRIIICGMHTLSYCLWDLVP